MSLLLAAAALGAAAWVIRIAAGQLAAADRGQLAAARDDQARAQALRQYAEQPGATPEDPIPIASPAAVEARAEALPCPQCGGSCHVTEHVVHFAGAERLRVAHLRCGQCGAPRSLYFRLASVTIN